MLLGFVVVGSLVELVSFVDNFGRAGRQEKLVLLFGSHVPGCPIMISAPPRMVIQESMARKLLLLVTTLLLLFLSLITATFSTPTPVYNSYLTTGFAWALLPEWPSVA